MSRPTAQSPGEAGKETVSDLVKISYRPSKAKESRGKLHAEVNRQILKGDIGKGLEGFMRLFDDPKFMAGLVGFLSILAEGKRMKEKKGAKPKPVQPSIAKPVQSKKVTPVPGQKKTVATVKKKEVLKKRGAECMTAEQINEHVNYNEKLAFLRDGAIDFNESITKTLKRAGDILTGKSNTKAITDVKYNWDAHSNSSGLGELQCARTVGNILGYGEGVHGYMAVTPKLIPALIAGNLKNIGKPGIVFGLDNYKKGDVVVFKGGNREGDYGTGRFSHVGIVRDILTIDGDRYIAMEHDTDYLRVDLIPINLNASKRIELNKKLKNPKERAKLIKKYPKLASIYDFRSGSNAEYVRVTKKTDASVRREGRIAFGIRTSTLT